MFIKMVDSDDGFLYIKIFIRSENNSFFIFNVAFIIYLECTVIVRSCVFDVSIYDGQY